MDQIERASLVRSYRFEMKQAASIARRRAEYERGLADRPGETSAQWVARQNAAIRRGDSYTRGDPASLGYPRDRTVRPARSTNNRGIGSAWQRRAAARNAADENDAFNNHGGDLGIRPLKPPSRVRKY